MSGNKQATSLQHQLYSEVADCYKKIAKVICGRGLAESMLIKRGASFTQFTVQATDLEVMGLSIQLSDLSHACIDAVRAVYAGVLDGLDSVVDAVLHPIDTAKGLGICLGKVIKYIGDAAIENDSSGFGWSYYVEQLEQEHKYDAVYAQAVVDEVKKWIEQSSWQEKVEFVARMGTEAILYDGLFTGVGKICSSVIAELPEIKFLGSFADLQVEYGVAIEFGEVGLMGMEDVGRSILKSEIDILGKNRSKSVTSKVLESRKRIYKEVKYHHQNSKGSNFSGKSRAPKNGQKALDDSILFKAKGNQGLERRIGIEDDYFVIFDEQRPGEFHGHVRTWEELKTKGNAEMQKILYEAGIIKNPKTGKM